MVIRERSDSPSASDADEPTDEQPPSAASIHASIAARRTRFIDAWLPEVLSIGTIAFSRTELRARLEQCVDRLIALFTADPEEAVRGAREIGRELADLFYLSSEGLERSQTVLSNELIQAMPGELREPRSTAVRLIAAIVSGYLERTRQAVLEEQESTRGALLQTLWRTQRELQASKARFQSLFFDSAIGIWVADIEGHTLDANPALLTMLGRDLTELSDLNVRLLIHPEDRAKFVPVWAQLTSGQTESFQAEARYLHKLGHTVWGHLTVSLVRDDQGQAQYLIAMLQDIGEQRRAEEALRNSDAQLRALVQNSADLIAVVNAWGEFIYLSPAISAMLGYEPDELVNEQMWPLFDEQDVPLVGEFWNELRARPGQMQQRSIRVRHKTGAWRWIGVTCANRFDDPSIQGIVINARDVTAQIDLEDRLAHLAYTDHLTGLASRRSFTERLQRALDNGRPLAVLFADLDRFKVINDSLGHEAGDQALVALAERFLACVGPDDVVARLGGDEFAVLLVGADEASAWETAQCLLNAMRAPVRLQQRHTVLNASIGIAVSGPDLTSQNDLLRAADLALYRAKAEGRAMAALFEPEMHDEAVERLELEADLRLALKLDELRLVYQPEVDLRTGKVVALEALVRWDRPGRGLASPEEFIDIAEETGLIVPIGRWVLADACAQMARWRDAGVDVGSIALSVNLSGRELRHDGLVEHVAACLRASGLAPRQLCLEVSERALTDELMAAVPVIVALRDLGVQLALDDFGAGQTSIASLPQIMACTLKIDRSLISPLGRHQADLAIVHVIAGLAHTLNMRVCAEGVETLDQLDQVRAAGCDHGQGYLFSPPLPSADVPAYLAKA